MKKATSFLLGMVTIIIIACSATANTETTANETENLKVIVKPNSSYVLLGQSFSAELYLAKDIPSETKLEIDAKNGNDEKIDTQNDKINYSITPTDVGMFKFSGKMILKDESSLPFTTEFSVSNPVAAVTNKYLIKGMDNPLNISVPGIPIHLLEVESPEGPITAEKGSYIVNPSETGEYIITVKATIDGELKTISEHTFEVIEN